MELIDTLKYFAKFPARNGILKCFNDIDTAMPEYVELKNYITNLQGVGLIPEIADFIIGTDEKVISERIKGIEGYFMYLEYAGIQSSASDNFQNRSTDFTLAIIIAHHHNSRNLDTMAETIIMDKCLSYLKQLYALMKADDKLICGNKRLTDAAIAINPIPPAILYQSFGWELAIRKTNNLLL